jgi:hypothetical protein
MYARFRGQVDQKPARVTIPIEEEILLDSTRR